MKLEVEKQTENPLLNRKEVIVKIDNEGSTPKKEELLAQLSLVLKAKPEQIVIETVKQKFGSQKSNVFVKVYDSAESLKAVEPKPKEKKKKPTEEEEAPAEGAPEEKHEGKEGAKPEEKPAEGEAPKEEKAEEKKEEAKEEPKEEKKEEKPEGKK